MKLKNSTILQLHQTIPVLASCAAFPTQTKVNIIRNGQAIERAFEVQTKFRLDLIARLAPDGKGETIDKSPDLLAKFNLEYQEMMDAKVDVTGLLYVNFAVLDEAKISPEVILRVLPLVRGLPNPDPGDVIPDTV